MGILWGPGANIAIFLAYYSYRKLWPWVHGVYFLFATIVTVATSISILQKTGIIAADSTEYKKYSGSTLNIHYLVGIVAFSATSLATLLGILTKLLNIFQAKSNTILLIRKIHLIAGYLFAALCKADVYIIANSRAGWIIQDAIFAILFVIWKIFFPKLEDKLISPKFDPVLVVRSIRSIK